MKQFVRSFLLGLFLLAPILVKSQDLEKILQKHFNAIGQAAILDMRSLQMEVREVDGFGGGRAYTVTKKAPNKIRIEGKWQEHIFVSAYDGKRAWTIAPWTGVLTPQLMTNEEQQALMLKADLGSPLYLGQNSDNTLSLKGTETILGDAHYVIRYTCLSGYFVDYFLDKKTYLIYQMKSYKAGNDLKVSETIIYKNYKDLGGFKLPFGFEIRSDRKSSDVLIDEIIMGQGASSAIFRMPEQ